MHVERVIDSMSW